MEMTEDASRHSASVAASLAVHAALALLLLGRGVVELTLQPTPIVLTFVQASTQTAGPGERSPELRVAAPAPEPEPAVPEPQPVRAEPEPEIVKAPAEPVPVVKPKSAPKKPERARAVASAAPPVIQSAPVTAPGGTGEGGHGDAARASAPAWAPTARVRYEELLFAWMNRHKEYPMLAQRRGLEGRGSLRVRIGRDGRVLERVLVSSTGQPVLDQAALDMVRRASPFPAVPEGYAGPSFEFVAPIEYRLR